MPKRFAECSVSFFFLTFGCYSIYEAWTLGLYSEIGPDSGTFPFIAGLMATIFSALNLVAISSYKTYDTAPSFQQFGQVVAIFFIVCAYLYLITIFGAFLPLPALVFAIALVIEPNLNIRWLVITIFTALTTGVVSYLTFVEFLRIRLPSGPLGF